MIVWLASYPRSGNTFFRVILNSVFNIKTYSIYNDRTDIGADEKTSEIVGHEFLPIDFDIEKARKEDKTYYIKTHELLDDRVYDRDKVIYLIRDGRESTLSFTNHENTFSTRKISIIDVIYGNTFIGAWGEHVASWSPYKRKNTLLIQFEELIKEPVSFIENIADFLDKKPTNQTVPTFAELKAVNPKFFRNGKTNSWENLYSNEEHIAFWMKNYPQMIEYGYTYNMPKEFESNTATLRELSYQNTYIMKLLLNNLHEKNKLLAEQKSKIEEQKSKIEEKNKIINSIYSSKRYKVAQKLAILNIFTRKCN